MADPLQPGNAVLTPANVQLLNRCSICSERVELLNGAEASSRTHRRCMGVGAELYQHAAIERHVQRASWLLTRDKKVQEVRSVS